MERLRMSMHESVPFIVTDGTHSGGYDILTGLLLHKSHLLNMSSFETIFEFLGIDFRSPK